MEILYFKNPAIRKNTLILWIGPFALFLLIIFLVVRWNITSKRPPKDLEAENIVKATEKTRLKKLVEGE
ncbi:MAG: hypothetical protein Ct9H300mP3_02630 [Gammaproteobacteria bacterium]|nr:MAG: hypothetical protein Ct9H300mP3_02630 [Gammaproteobacteria bacterium]